MDATTPAHLIGEKWRSQHNFRLTPTLQQVLKKVQLTAPTGTPITFIGYIPSFVSGYGQQVVLTSPTRAQRWSTTLYNGTLYTSLSNYITIWYDHFVKAAINTVQISDLYDFTNFTPDATNEADYYDLVEWQQPDYLYCGITGIGKLGSTLWIYTPTAIIPMQYVGLPKVIQVVESGVITRIGNSFPWTLVCLGNVHFFYEAYESMFFAFNGGGAPEAIGEPVREFIQQNLNPDPTLAKLMYGYIDVDNREIWWPFVSKNSIGAYDLAVVFNYRYKRWFTASVEDVTCFCGRGFETQPIGDLSGTIGNLIESIDHLSLSPAETSRLFGTGVGQTLREELSTDSSSSLLPTDDPVLESGDFHYGDIRTQKENDAMVINAWWEQIDFDKPLVEVRVATRNYLGEGVKWSADPVATWTPDIQDSIATYEAVNGRILRYKFTFKNTRQAVLSAYSDVVLVKLKAEK
jgi:hypothetical protein